MARKKTSVSGALLGAFIGGFTDFMKASGKSYRKTGQSRSRRKKKFYFK